MTWTAGDSPVCVQGSVTVHDLTIEEGVVVQVAPGAEIQVLGILRAEGSAAEPVVFTELQAGMGWTGILFQDAPAGSVLSHCRIEHAQQSGIRLRNSLPVIESCVLEQNSTDARGGGIDAVIDTGTLVISGCRVAGNTARGHGGGLNAELGTGFLQIEDCSFEGNATDPQTNTPESGNPVGGGLRIDGSARLVRCEVRSNTCTSKRNTGTSTARGGGLFVAGGTVELENCTVSDNLANALFFFSGVSGSVVARGGGVYAGGGTVTLTSSIVSCNSTGGGGISSKTFQGGGIYAEAGDLAVVNATVVRNQLAGIANGGASVDVRNSIVYDNNGGGDQFTGTVTAEYSDVQLPPPGVYPGTGNINACLLYTSPSPRDQRGSRMPSSA